MTVPQKPIPAITPELAPFFAAARRHQLVVQRCRECGAYRFPAREICSDCLSTQADWVPVSGHGEVFSFNVMHQIYHPGFANDVPYAVVLVKLAEGAKMISNLVGVKPHEIKIGMRVEVVFEDVTEEVTLPKFRPVSPSARQPVSGAGVRPTGRLNVSTNGLTGTRADGRTDHCLAAVP